MSTLHRDLSADVTDGVALHVPGIIDTADPASTYGTGSSDGVFAGLLWIEESSTDTFNTLKYRNSSNDGWIEMDLDVSYDDDEKLEFGTGADYWFVYNSTGTQFELWSTDVDGGGSDGLIFDVADGADVLDFTSTPTVGGTNVVLETRTITAGTGLTGGGDLSANRTLNVSGLTDSEISASAEIAVSKLADGTARQLLQTDAAGTGVEWASNIDIPGTLDVTGAVTLDSTLAWGGGSAIADSDNVALLDINNTFSGRVAVERAVATAPAFTVDLAGDADFRVNIRADGLFAFGDGTNAEDAFLERISAAHMRFTSTDLTVDGDLTTTGAATLDTGANGSSFGGALQIVGDLNHDGTNLGLYGAAPVAQPTTAIGEASFVENAGGTAVNVDSTFGGYTLQQIAQILLNVGLAS